MALSHAQPRQQLARTEGLGHVIIRTVVERGDLILLAVAHGEHDHGHMAPLAQALEHSDSFHVGQAQVENDHIRRALGGFGDALLAGGGFGDAVAVGLQAYAEEAANLEFVVND